MSNAYPHPAPRELHEAMLRWRGIDGAPCAACISLAKTLRRGSDAAATLLAQAKEATNGG